MSDALLSLRDDSPFFPAQESATALASLISNTQSSTLHDIVTSLTQTATTASTLEPALASLTSLSLRATGIPSLANIAESAAAKPQVSPFARVRLPSLRYLDVSWTPINNVDLSAILKACPVLDSLNIDACNLLTPEAVRAAAFPSSMRRLSTTLSLSVDAVQKILSARSEKGGTIRWTHLRLRSRDVVRRLSKTHPAISFSSHRDASSWIHWVPSASQPPSRNKLLVNEPFIPDGAEDSDEPVYNFLGHLVLTGRGSLLVEHMVKAGADVDLGFPILKILQESKRTSRSLLPLISNWLRLGGNVSCLVGVVPDAKQSKASASIGELILDTIRGRRVANGKGQTDDGWFEVAQTGIVVAEALTKRSGIKPDRMIAWIESIVTLSPSSTRSPSDLNSLNMRLVNLIGELDDDVDGKKSGALRHSFAARAARSGNWNLALVLLRQYNETLDTVIDISKCKLLPPAVTLLSDGAEVTDEAITLFHSALHSSSSAASSSVRPEKGAALGRTVKCIIKVNKSTTHQVTVATPIDYAMLHNLSLPPPLNATGQQPSLTLIALLIETITPLLSQVAAYLKALPNLSRLIPYVSSPSRLLRLSTKEQLESWRSGPDRASFAIAAADDLQLEPLSLFSSTDVDLVNSLDSRGRNVLHILGDALLLRGTGSGSSGLTAMVAAGFLVSTPKLVGRVDKSGRTVKRVWERVGDVGRVVVMRCDQIMKDSETVTVEVKMEEPDITTTVSNIDAPHLESVKGEPEEAACPESHPIPPVAALQVETGTVEPNPEIKGEPPLDPAPQITPLSPTLSISSSSSAMSFVTNPAPGGEKSILDDNTKVTVSPTGASGRPSPPIQNSVQASKEPGRQLSRSRSRSVSRPRFRRSRSRSRSRRSRSRDRGRDGNSRMYRPSYDDRDRERDRFRRADDRDRDRVIRDRDRGRDRDRERERDRDREKDNNRGPGTWSGGKASSVDTRPSLDTKPASAGTVRMKNNDQVAEKPAAIAPTAISSETDPGKPSSLCSATGDPDKQTNKQTEHQKLDNTKDNTNFEQQERLDSVQGQSQSAKEASDATGPSSKWRPLTVLDNTSGGGSTEVQEREFSNSTNGLKRPVSAADVHAETDHDCKRPRISPPPSNNEAQKQHSGAVEFVVTRKEGEPLAVRASRSLAATDSGSEPLSQRFSQLHPTDGNGDNGRSASNDIMVVSVISADGMSSRSVLKKGSPDQMQPSPSAPVRTFSDGKIVISGGASEGTDKAAVDSSSGVKERNGHVGQYMIRQDLSGGSSGKGEGTITQSGHSIPQPSQNTTHPQSQQVSLKQPDRRQAFQTTPPLPAKKPLNSQTQQTSPHQVSMQPYAWNGLNQSAYSPPHSMGFGSPWTLHGRPIMHQLPIQHGVLHYKPRQSTLPQPISMSQMMTELQHQGPLMSIMQPYQHQQQQQQKEERSFTTNTGNQIAGAGGGGGGGGGSDTILLTVGMRLPSVSTPTTTTTTTTTTPTGNNASGRRNSGSSSSKEQRRGGGVNGGGTNIGTSKNEPQSEIHAVASRGETSKLKDICLTRPQLVAEKDKDGSIPVQRYIDAVRAMGHDVAALVQDMIRRGPPNCNSVVYEDNKGRSALSIALIKDAVWNRGERSQVTVALLNPTTPVREYLGPFSMHNIAYRILLLNVGLDASPHQIQRQRGKMRNGPMLFCTDILLYEHGITVTAFGHLLRFFVENGAEIMRHDDSGQRVEGIIRGRLSQFRLGIDSMNALDRIFTESFNLARPSKR